MTSLPYLFRYIRDEDDLLVDIKTLSDPTVFRSLFARVVIPLEWVQLDDFMELNKIRYRKIGLPKYNFLSLRRDPFTPFIYLKKGTYYREQIKVSYAHPLDRARIIRYTEISPNANLMVSYVKTRDNGSTIHAMDSFMVSLKGYVNLTNVALRHSLIGN
jgi:hypothetical protein